MLVKTDAVVLKQTKFGEGDVIVTLFSKKLGKVQAVAKGARKTRSKYATGIQLFAYGEYVLFKGKNLYTLSQVDIKHSFYGLREDVIRLAYASYILELTESVIVEGQTNNRLFKTLVKCLYILSSKKYDYETLVKAYELKLLTYSGYQPELDQCVNCGMENAQGVRFSAKEGGILCKTCLEKDPYAIPISKVAISVMSYLIHVDFIQLSKLKIKEHVLKELKKVVRQYIYTYIDKNRFNSLEILKEVKS